jgi:hypothetical protein
MAVRLARRRPADAPRLVGLINHARAPPTVDQIHGGVKQIAGAASSDRHGGRAMRHSRRPAWPVGPG